MPRLVHLLSSLILSIAARDAKTVPCNVEHPTEPPVYPNDPPIYPTDPPVYPTDPPTYPTDLPCQNPGVNRKLGKKTKTKKVKVATTGPYYFDYYPIENNPNCPQQSKLSMLFGKHKKFKELIDNACCSFQDEVVSDQDAADDAHGLNLIHVYMGQIIMSHDTAATQRSKTKINTQTCDDGRQFLFGALLKKHGDWGNGETACIDASTTYSALESRTSKLAKGTFPKLRDGKSVDVCPVSMDDPMGRGEPVFALGDSRGNENPVLTALHLMWASRHNQWVDKYSQDTSFTDGQLFEKARARTIAETQRVSKLYMEALIGRPLPYDQDRAKSGKEVRMFAEYAHAANRMQHAQIKKDFPIQSSEQGGSTVRLSMSEALFNPEIINQHGISSIIRGSANTACSIIGMNFVNELIGNVGTLDGPNLALIDCFRGREFNMKPYHDVRHEQFGENVDSWQEINPDVAAQEKLRRIYNDDFKNIDLFVGGLAEQHEAGSSVGKTFSAIMVTQMEEFMYHDEGWYENTLNVGPLSSAELEEVKAMTLADILLQSTDIGCVPTDAFRIPGPMNPLICDTDTYYHTPFKTDTLV